MVGFKTKKSSFSSFLVINEITFNQNDGDKIHQKQK
jgi:hypothetical protein